MDEINNYIIAMKLLMNKTVKDYTHNVTPKVYCYDGFSISIQASCIHHCEPRDESLLIDNITQIHHTFELGFPSQIEPILTQYKEMPEDEDVQSVYPQVPLSIVLEIIEIHGGIDYNKTFEKYINLQNGIIKSSL